MWVPILYDLVVQSLLHFLMDTNGDIKRHGRWKSDVGKGGYIEDTFEKKLLVSQGQDYDFSKFSALSLCFL